MADTLFIVPIQMWVYWVVRALAVHIWLANRAGLLAGLMIQLATDWITTDLFGPAIGDFTFLSEGLFPTFFTIAVLLLAISYLIAPFFQVRVVDMQKAAGWLLFALLFYEFGPGLYVSGEQVRRAISSEFYGQVLEQANSTPTGGSMALLSNIAAGPDDAMGALDNQFGAFVPTDQYVDGLDIAMAYTLSTGDDVVYSLTDLPTAFDEEYFDPARGPLFFLTMTPQERTDSINEGLTGVTRLLLSYVIIFFGLFEQAIYLCLSIAMGILFISMGIAILFAFFERTEMMARTLIDMWLELFIFSVIVAMLQAFIVGFVTLGARTLNPTMTLGASLIGGIVMCVLLLKAVSTIWDALNRLFAAMGQLVGGRLMSPAEAGVAAAGAAAGTALTIATAGAGMAVTAMAGGTLAQVAGSALSGSDMLYNTAALGSMVLPDSSPMKESAQGFYEGALSNRMLGPVGGLMLRERGESSATSPAESPVQTAAPASGGNGSAGNVTHSFDLAGMKDAVRAAITQAIATAPTGGYASPQDALQGVRTALGSAGGDPRLGDYLDRRAHSIGQRVYVESREQTRSGSPTVNVSVSADKPNAPSEPASFTAPRSQSKSRPEGDRS